MKMRSVVLLGFLGLFIGSMAVIVWLMLGVYHSLTPQPVELAPGQVAQGRIYLHLFDGETGDSRPSYLPAQWQNGALIRLTYGRLTHYVPPPAVGDASVDLEPGEYQITAGWQQSGQCFLFSGHFLVKDPIDQQLDLPAKPVPCAQYPQ